MRLSASLVLSALLTAAALSAPPTLDIPPEVRPNGQYALFVPKTDAVGIEFVGLDGIDPVPTAVLKDARTFLLDTRGLRPARYRFVAVGSSASGELARVAFVLVVGDAPPPGPTPPGPTPDPPSPAPIPGAGLRVLLVYEAADLARYPAGQVAALYSQEVRDYLNAKCPKGPGQQPEWRCWDKDVPTANESATWQNAMKRPRASTPWIIVSNGTAGFEGPLPASVADLLALLRKYGG